MFRTLTDTLLVAPQISVADITEAAREGVTLVINNRPDGEAPDQVPGAEIEIAARAAGLDYVAIPITPGGFNQSQIAEMQTSLAGATGKVLAYCRTGTRSTNLWALSQAASGGEPAELVSTAAGAGYDLAPLIPLLNQLRDGA